MFTKANKNQKVLTKFLYIFSNITKFVIMFILSHHKIWNHKVCEKVSVVSMTALIYISYIFTFNK